MPATSRIDKPLGVVFTKSEGVLTYQEIKDHQQALLQDPNFDPSFNQLLDLTEVTAFDCSTDEWRILVSTKLHGEGSRRAIVVPEQTAIYGMLRMAQILRDSEPDNIQIFRDIDEARKWLGLE